MNNDDLPSNEDFDSDEERRELTRHERACEGAWLRAAECSHEAQRDLEVDCGGVPLDH